jgi:hypothetical protein
MCACHAINNFSPLFTKCRQFQHPFTPVVASRCRARLPPGIGKQRQQQRGLRQRGGALGTVLGQRRGCRQQ